MVVLIVLCVILAVFVVALLGRNALLEKRINLINDVESYSKSLICSLDLEKHRIISASAGLLEIFGIARADCSKHNPQEVIHPDDLPLLLSTIEIAKDKEQRGFPKEKTFDRLRVRLLDARYGWQWYELYGFFYGDPEHLMLCCSFFPMNDQMRLSEELGEIKKRMDIMLNNSFDIVWTMNCLTRQLVLINDVTKERFGIDNIKAGEIIVNDRYFPEEDILAFREMLNTRIAKLSDSGLSHDEPLSFYVHVKNRDGSLIYVCTRSTLEKNELGQYTLYGVTRIAEPEK